MKTLVSKVVLAMSFVSMLSACATPSLAPEGGRKIQAHGEAPSEADATDYVRAAVKGDLKTVEAHLRAGTPVDTPNKFGTTAVMAAASRGHLSVLELLLNNGARVDIVDKDQLTALAFAISASQTEAVRFLLDHGADPNQKTFGDLPPLFLAVVRNQPAIVEALLQAGADMTVRDEDGKSALDIARHNEFQVIVHLLENAQNASTIDRQKVETQ